MTQTSFWTASHWDRNIKFRIWIFKILQTPQKTKNSQCCRTQIKQNSQVDPDLPWLKIKLLLVCIISMRIIPKKDETQSLTVNLLLINSLSFHLLSHIITLTSLASLIMSAALLLWYIVSPLSCVYLKNLKAVPLYRWEVMIRGQVMVARCMMVYDMMEQKQISEEHAERQ